MSARISNFCTLLRISFWAPKNPNRDQREDWEKCRDPRGGLGKLQRSDVKSLHLHPVKIGCQVLASTREVFDSRDLLDQSPPWFCFLVVHMMPNKNGHSFTPIESRTASRCQGAPNLCRSDNIFKNCKMKPTPQCRRGGQQLTQRVRSAVLSSGNRTVSIRQLFPGVLQCTLRNPLGNRPTRHLTVAILVALGMGPPAPLTPYFSPARSLESAWPQLYRLKSCLWSRTSRNRRSSRCRRVSGQGVGVQRRRRRRGWRANDADNHGL